MTDSRLLTVVLAVLIALSGCTGGFDVNDGDRTASEPFVTTPTTPTGMAANPTETASTGTASETEPSAATPTASATETATATDSPPSTAAETPTPSPTSTSTATSSPTATPTPDDEETPTATSTPTPTPNDDGERNRSEWGDEFVDRLESQGIEVVHLELADDNWMLTYRADVGSWAADADKLQIIAETYCGLFEDGMAVGPEGSDFLASDALDSEGDFRYVTYVNPRWCDSTEEGGFQLTEDDFMFTVLNTLNIGEYPSYEELETGDRYLSQATAGQWLVDDVEDQGIDVIELKMASRSDDAEDHVWFLHYTTGVESWGDYVEQAEIITMRYCRLFDEGLEHGEDGSTYLAGEPHDPDGEPFEYRPGWTVRPHLCDDGSDALMQRVFQSLTL